MTRDIALKNSSYEPDKLRRNHLKAYWSCRSFVKFEDPEELCNTKGKKHEFKTRLQVGLWKQSWRSKNVREDPKPSSSGSVYKQSRTLKSLDDSEHNKISKTTMSQSVYWNLTECLEVISFICKKGLQFGPHQCCYNRHDKNCNFRHNLTNKQNESHLNNAYSFATLHWTTEPKLENKNEVISIILSFLN